MLIARLTQWLAIDLYHNYIYDKLSDPANATKEELNVQLLNGEKYDVDYYVQVITKNYFTVHEPSRVEGNIAIDTQCA